MDFRLTFGRLASIWVHLGEMVGHLGVILGTFWPHEGLPEALEERASKNSAPGDDHALENITFRLIWAPRGGAKIV